ncbi:hypothetical protein, conserved [Babesia bigemina]|uniref:AMP-dependent synthetase/ligase domain-containing protein n=1 Tax=Babesia bigemina TaxID=5866 RepID=A0A061D257_BABBI|nr:hypothetical protein, conserved [Babesia bigemina]CDR94826.1 hypothetical protein, conserved [Babesia bigemina]|eukprot:XP_012767012.1 hypothetical protein, conserved [Babesia bigemina]
MRSSLESLICDARSRRKIEDRPVFLTVLSQPSTAFVDLLFAIFKHGGVAVSVLPVCFSLLRSRLATSDPTCFEKHIVDNWRSMIVEACSDVVVTTRDYYPLLSPVCRELTVPLHVLVRAPSVISASEFDAAMRAGHGYFDLMDTPNTSSEVPEDASQLLGNCEREWSLLHVFSEIGSCNGKVVAHTRATLDAEGERVRNVFSIGANDQVLNCLFPHECGFIMYGVLQPIHVGARAHYPLVVPPVSRYSSLKPQFPLTLRRDLRETVTLSLAQSVFEYVRCSRCSPSVLLCGPEMLRYLLEFISCGELSASERRSYLGHWAGVDRIYVIVDASQLDSGSLIETVTAFLKATSLTASVTQLYTLPEVGVVAHRDLRAPHSTPIAMPGCAIIEHGSNFTITARTGSVFQSYLGRQHATKCAFVNGELRLKFRMPVESTPLLPRHLEYVTYFKRRRERMSRYPQGYIKQVPVRTQFWGNYTGRKRHPSVL